MVILLYDIITSADMQLVLFFNLQNNGVLAFQTLFHVHFHLIPKNSTEDGLRYLRDRDEVHNFDQSGIADQIIRDLTRNIQGN